jgi:hypothetical protein
MIIDEDQNIEEEVVLDVQQDEEEVIEDSETSEEPESEETEPEIDQDEEEDDEEDRVVTIGDEPSEDAESEDAEEAAHKEAPKWVKTLRKKSRRQESEIKRLKRQIEANQQATEEKKPVEVGPKPKLSEYNYDDQKFADAVIQWTERKKEVEAQEAEKTRVLEEQTKAYETKKQRYIDSRKEHSFKDYSDAEEIVTETLSPTQQGIIIEGAKDSALLTYALGKNPKKLEELSKLSNPVEFAFELARVETQLNVRNKKAPSPERRVKSGKAGGISGTSDKVLDRLRDEAAKTGDYTKVKDYKKKLKSKG